MRNAESDELQALLRDALVQIRGLRTRLSEAEARHSEPVAIIGTGCRFPGGVYHLESFWQLLHAGVDAVGIVPPDRWDIDALYHPDPATPGRMYTRYGSFLQDIGHFDASFFGISPTEAKLMDPQQRLMLEVAWEALEDAGLIPETLRTSRTGVFVGVMYNDYAMRQVRENGLEGHRSPLRHRLHPGRHCWTPRLRAGTPGPHPLGGYRLLIFPGLGSPRLSEPAKP